MQSKDECEYLINLAKPQMQKSTVVDSSTGKSKDSRCAFLTLLIGINFMEIFSDEACSSINSLLEIFFFIFFISFLFFHAGYAQALVHF